MSTKRATRTVQSKGAILEVLTSGDSPATTKRVIVAVACGGALDPLAKISWPIEEMQLRGYGKSSFEAAADKQTSSLSDYVGDLDAVIQSSTASSTVLLGYSHGGYFTTAYALAHPSRLAGLILIEPALFNSREELLHRAQLAQQGKNEESLEIMLQQVQPNIGMIRETAQEGVKAIMQNINNQHTLSNELRIRAENPISESALSKLSMPVLLIGGTRSHVSNIITRFQQHLPTASVWWIKGAEHTNLMSAQFSGQLEAVVNTFVTEMG